MPFRSLQTMWSKPSDHLISNGAVKRISRLLTSDLLQQRYLRRIRREVIKSIPDRDSHTSSRFQDLFDLAQGLALVSEEHETKLTYHSIEGFIREW